MCRIDFGSFFFSLSLNSFICKSLLYSDLWSNAGHRLQNYLYVSEPLFSEEKKTSRILAFQAQSIYASTEMSRLKGSVYRRGKIWWIAYYVDGQQVRESSGSTEKHEAEILLAKRKSQPRSDNRLISEILESLANHFLISEKSPWGPLVINRRLIPHFGSMNTSDITKDDINRYAVKRKGEGMENATINKEITLLRRAFNFAELKFPKIPKLPEAPPREGFFTTEEFESLYTELPEHIKPIALIGYYTGCRLGEILGLRWKQLDLASRTIRLRAGETKSGYGRVIPLPQKVVDSLQGIKRDSEWVFTFRGRPIRTISTGWNDACKRAGVDRLFHDLRRTAVRNLVRAGVPERVAMEISGHRTRSIFDRYNIVGEDELLTAIDQTVAKLGVKST